MIVSSIFLERTAILVSFSYNLSLFHGEYSYSGWSNHNSLTWIVVVRVYVYFLQWWALLIRFFLTLFVLSVGRRQVWFLFKVILDS